METHVPRRPLTRRLLLQPAEFPFTGLFPALLFAVSVPQVHDEVPVCVQQRVGTGVSAVSCHWGQERGD